MPLLPHGTIAPGPLSDHTSGPEKPPNALKPREDSVTFGGLEEKRNMGWVGIMRLRDFIHS